MSAVGRRIVERAPAVPRLAGPEQEVRDGLSFLDEAEPCTLVFDGGLERVGAVVARRTQVYARWQDDHGITHLGWLSASAVRPHGRTSRTQRAMAAAITRPANYVGPQLSSETDSEWRARAVTVVLVALDEST